MKPKKVLALILCMLMTLSFLSACSGGTTAASEADGSASTPTAAGSDSKASGEQTVIRFSTFADDIRMQRVNAQLEEFMTENPHLKVEVEHTSFEDYYEKKMAETAAGQLPDVMDFTPGYGAYWIYQGLLKDITPYVEADPDTDFANYDEIILGYFTQGEEILALPYDTNAVIVYYNKDLFDEAGIEYPSPDWTYEDMAAIMKEGVAALAAKGKDVWGLAAPIGLGWTGNGYFDANGTPLIGDDGKIGVNADTVPFLQMWLDWMEDGLMPTPEPANPQNINDGGTTTFMNNKSLMLFDTTGGIQYIEAGMNYGCAPPPYGAGGLRGSKLGGGWAMSANTKVPDEAYELLRFLGSEQFDRAYILDSGSGVPAFKSLIGEMDGQIKESAEQALVDGYVWMNAVRGSNEVWALKDRLLSDLWIGNLTPEQWVEEMTRQGNELIESAQDT